MDQKFLRSLNIKFEFEDIDLSKSTLDNVSKAKDGREATDSIIEKKLINQLWVVANDWLLGLMIIYFGVINGRLRVVISAPIE